MTLPGGLPEYPGGHRLRWHVFESLPRKRAVNEVTPSRVWHDPNEVPSQLAPGVVTIGNFDGVHGGHRRVIDSLVSYASAHDLVPRALTFHPHPRHVMTGSEEPMLITGYEDRNSLVCAAGVADLLDVNFTLEFAQLTAEDFVREYLVELLGARAVVLGKDSRFGRRNEGDFQTMVDLGEKYGFEVVSVEELGADLGGDAETGERISSSLIRECLLAGNTPEAARMLGRWHTVRDTVRHGFKRGRELGFPTANFSAHPCGAVPIDGVYAGYFSILDGDRFLERVPATISVGTNPTFDEGPAHRIVETYVHGSHEYELYDRQAQVEFVERLRPTLAFDGIDALVDQMHRDVAVTRSTLAAHGDPRV